MTTIMARQFQDHARSIRRAFRLLPGRSAKIIDFPVPYLESRGRFDAPGMAEECYLPTQPFAPPWDREEATASQAAGPARSVIDAFRRLANFK